MSLFQKSVEQKYLNDLDQKIIDDKYKKFQDDFGNSEKQENIRKSKEEEYQSGFLEDLFVRILGYTLNPEPNFNLKREFKNVTDSRKADGAILKENEAIAVIELKSTAITDLDSIENQAFTYKNHHPNCKYVITSNFEKLRFYIEDAVDYIEFELFNLTKEKFSLLWLCLSKDNLIRDIPLNIKKASVFEEKDVTKKLYEDYSKFREEIFNDIVSNNKSIDKLTLFKKTQKLLDRFLFIFFAEDRLLLPPNSISEIIRQWQEQKSWGDKVRLYDRFKKYFHLLNIGWKGKKYEIFPYNGGLFAPDKILENIVISDEPLEYHTRQMSSYNFNPEKGKGENQEEVVDVNILGHIFEHSIGQIENIQAELQGVKINKERTKRKKEGIYYTPNYITKYIIHHTLGKLCEEKREELAINEEEYTKGRKNRKKTIIKKLDEKLNEYREWLLSLSILDPACGSGAFLNQALEFLIKEHKKVDELHAQLFESSLVLSDITNEILERNLYGIDLNEESVEIAKLSLWLRTAQKGRKLNKLTNNIKCGNSLIDDSDVAGEKAFNWKNEFPEVFETGGFDIVIGNPPYLRMQGLRENFKKESKYYEKKYKSATGRFDIYVLFIERAFNLITTYGKIGFILPHKFMVSDFGEGIRSFLSKHKAVESIVHFGSEMVFDDASTYTCILTLSHNNNQLYYNKIKPSELFNSFKFYNLDINLLTEKKWNLQNAEVSKIITKIKNTKFFLKDIFSWVSQGVVSVGDNIFVMQGEFKGNKFIGYSKKIDEYIEIEAELMKPLLKGEDVKQYAPLKPKHYILYPHYQNNTKTLPYEEDYFKNNFPLAYNYLFQFKEELIEKKKRYKTNPKYWYSLHRSREIQLFEQEEKIITPEISLGTNMTIDRHQLYHNTKCYSLIKNPELEVDYRYLLALLNSSIMWFFLYHTGYILRGGYFTFKTKYLETFPIYFADKNTENQIISQVDSITEKMESLQEIQSNFINFFQAKFNIKRISKKMFLWYDMDYQEFFKEIKKLKIKMSLSEESEWGKYFNEQQQLAQSIKTDIFNVNKEIDKMVYKLYGLTDKEIKIVEDTT
jgi:type I restriction-modification system DNA methylase subunit